MSEADRNPAIRIHIDQQVYIDAILGHEEIEDATVVTEVVGFDRNETNYRLEGALVFSGYIRQAEEQELEVTSEDLQGDIGSALQDDEMTVQQIHCRMPFTLEVPVEAQRSEFINVVARVGTWNLSTLGPKWVHVRAELVVNGLTGEEGYRFRCGTQEEGIPDLQPLAFVGGFRSAEDGVTEPQVSGADQEEPSLDAQQANSNDSPPQQFPYYSPWQRGVEGGERPLDGAYPFSAPFTTPYVRPAQPLSWERKWPEAFEDRSPQEAGGNVREENVGFESFVQESNPQARSKETVSGSEDYAAKVDEPEQEQEQAVHFAEQTHPEEPTFGSSYREAAADETVLKEEYRAEQSQPKRDAFIAEDTQEFETGSVDVDTDTTGIQLQNHSEPVDQAEVTYHFEEVAESSTLKQEPQFQLKIKPKSETESSTFGAMSTLMEATQAELRESASSSKPELRESASDSKTISRESSSYLSKNSPSSVIFGSESKVSSEDQTVEIVSVTEPKVATPEVSAPIVDVEVVEVVEPAVVIEQERPAELVSESGTVLDVKVADEQQLSAAVTIAERKQHEVVSDHVYLWTELYPFLEETFQSIKFRIAQKDDSVDRIAEAYRITTLDLMRANHMQTEQIDVGQLLYIPIKKR